MANSGNYVKGDCIGKGSFGEVYRGFEKSTARDCALKLVDLEVVNDEIDVIQREIKVMSQISNDDIVQYYASFMEGSTLWIVMEYLAGGSLKELIDAIGPLPEDAIAAVMRALLRGLTYVHNEGKVHRDIKAANVLLSSSGDVKLADFGVAGQMTATIRQRHTFVGSPFWMAPEVIQESAYNQKADIWSLGITAYELATGLPPHASEHPYRALFLIPKSDPPRLAGSGFSKQFKSFLEACLQRNPAERLSAEALSNHSFMRKARNSAVKECLKRKRDMEKLKDLNIHGVPRNDGPSRAGDATPSLHGSMDSSLAGSVVGGTVSYNGGTVHTRSSGAPSRWEFDSVDGFEVSNKDAKPPLQCASDMKASPVLSSTTGRSVVTASDSPLQSKSATVSPVRSRHDSLSLNGAADGEPSFSSSETDIDSITVSPASRPVASEALSSPSMRPLPRSALTKSAPAVPNQGASRPATHTVSTSQSGARHSSPPLQSQNPSSTVLSDLILPVIMQMRADVATRDTPDGTLVASLGKLEVAFADAETARPGVCATIVESLFKDALAVPSREVKAILMRALQHYDPELAAQCLTGTSAHSGRRPPTGSQHGAQRASR